MITHKPSKIPCLHILIKVHGDLKVRKGVVGALIISGFFVQPY